MTAISHASTDAGLRALLDHGSAGAALMDADARYVFVTRDFEEAHGLATGTMVGATDAQVLPARAAAERARAQRDAATEGRARFEYVVRGARVSGDVLALADDTGASYGVVLRAHEHDGLPPASEIRRRLQDAERRGRVGSWIWDLSTDTVVWSDELYRMYSRPDDGHPIPLADALDLQHPRDRQMLVDTLRRSIRSRSPFAFEHRIIAADGQLRWMQCQGTVEVDDDGRAIRVRGTDQDITERRAVRAQITRLHQRSQLLLESVSEGIVELDGRARIVFLNGAALHMLGDARGELAGAPLAERLTTPGATSPVHPILASLEDRRERYVERAVLRQAGGAELAVDFTCTPLMHQAQKEGVVVALRDRTQRDGYEERIAGALSALVEAQELERRRIAGEIHDDAVQAMSAVALRAEHLAGAAAGDGAEELERLLGVVREATGRLRQLLVQLQPPELAEAIGTAIEAYVESTDMPFRHAMIDRLHSEPDIATRVVLYRIAQEALRNAAKHARATTVRTELLEVRDMVWLVIADDGVGVDDEILHTSQPGHLGLETMRYRAELAGGRCDVTSVPGEGTTVTVKLPRRAEESR